MDSNNSEGRDKSAKNSTSNSDMRNGSNPKDYTEDDMKSTSGPTVLLLWVWNWFAALPQQLSKLYTDFKSGELLSKFSLLDAMLQFIVAVATSCHPQEEGFSGEVDEKPDSSSTKGQDIKSFEGTGRTLRSRTVATNS